MATENITSSVSIGELKEQARNYLDGYSTRSKDALAEIAQLCRAESWRLASWNIEEGLKLLGQESSVDTGTNDPLASQLEVSVLPSVFTQQFTVSYHLDEPGLVSMRLLDVAGREVASLLLEERMGAGDHLFGFDSAQKGLAPGVYFLNINVDGAQRTLKLVKEN